MKLIYLFVFRAVNHMKN